MSTPTMTGKTVLITGANSGIGLATAKGLAKLGARVVMLCRNREKAEAARAEVIQTSGNSDVHLILADLSVQAEIHRAADEFKSRFNRLDVLINNAALIPPKREVTKDGIEAQFAINHLSYFLLTHLLLDVLKASKPARIINLSSNLHANGKINFDDLQTEKAYPRFGLAQYPNTKLMNHLFTFELARRLEGSGITVNCVHPGVIGTNLSRGMPKLIQRVYFMFVGKPEDGAKTSIYLASSPDVAKISGEYFVDSKVAPSAPAAHDTAVARRLWDISAKMVNLEQSEVALA